MPASAINVLWTDTSLYQKRTIQRPHHLQSPLTAIKRREENYHQAIGMNVIAFTGDRFM